MVELKKITAVLMVIALLLIVSCSKKPETMQDPIQEPESADSSVSSFSNGMDSINEEEQDLNGGQLDGVDSGLSEVESS